MKQAECDNRSQLGHVTVQLCHLISAKSSCKSSSPLGHAPTRNRANQSPSSSVGCGHVHPCCRPCLCRQSTATFPTQHSRPTASQPCIDPPSVSEGSHQAATLLCSTNGYMLSQSNETPTQPLETSGAPQEGRQTRQKSSCLRTFVVTS